MECIVAKRCVVREQKLLLKNRHFFDSLCEIYITRNRLVGPTKMNDLGLCHVNNFVTFAFECLGNR